MRKSCINIKPLTNASELHNTRHKELDYVRKELSPLNESWTDDRYQGKSFGQIRKDIAERYQTQVRQKMQAKAKPLREGVVVLDDHVTLNKLKELAALMEATFGIKTIQIHIHRDEGHVDADSREWKPNLHAHMVFDWTKPDGRSQNLKRDDMAHLQTIVAETLGMERGQSSDVKHLGAVQYKNKMQAEENLRLRQEAEELNKALDSLKRENGSLKTNNTELQSRMAELSLMRDELQSDIRKMKITRNAKEALQQRLNAFTSILGKSDVQKKYEATAEELSEVKEHMEELQAKLNDIQVSLDQRTKERDTARKSAASYRKKAERLGDEVDVLSACVVKARKENLLLRSQLEPRTFALPEDVDMEHTSIVNTPGGHSLRVFFTDGGRAHLISLQNDDYKRYISGKVTLSQLVGQYCTDVIDHKVAKRIITLRVEKLEAALRKIESTIFFQLPNILFPLRAMNVPAGSRDGINPNIIHKSREEILRELIEEGYQVRMSY